MTAPYRWCVLYADTADPAAVVAMLATLLGPADALDVFRVPGGTVEVRRNPDRTGGDHYLDWPTMIEIDVDAGVADRTVVTFVTALITHLHAGHLRIAPDCDFATALPPPDTR